MELILARQPATNDNNDDGNADAEAGVVPSVAASGKNELNPLWAGLAAAKMRA